eukprot:TRINITY_DN56261_c0_g1_i1.p1 TRINITY_DN56261_c0_g1~~TRINITY_DN56261_c0_g1_i1.p1  ORF type:complete len:583 (-),score=107.58 TRINITY_DN56261_c0_g1_i1:74-1822(-)
MADAGQWLYENMRCGLLCWQVERHKSLGRSGQFQDACVKTTLRINRKSSSASIMLDTGLTIPLNEITAVELHRTRPASPTLRVAPEESITRLATLRWRRTGQACQAAQYVYLMFGTAADAKAFVEVTDLARRYGVRTVLRGFNKRQAADVAAPSPWQLARGRERFKRNLRAWRGFGYGTVIREEPTAAEEEVDGDQMAGLKVEPDVHCLWTDVLQGRQATEISEFERDELMTAGVPLKHRHALWSSWVATPDLGDIDAQQTGMAEKVRNQIMLDVPRTRPELLMPFQREVLTRVLFAFATRSPEIGYCQGMNFLVMVFVLLGFSEATCFAGLCHLTERVCPDYHGPNLEGYIRDTAVLGVLVHHLLPDVNSILESLDIQLATIALDHFISGSARNLHVGAVVRLWDVILSGGTPALLAAFLAFLELYFPRAAGVGFEAVAARDAFPGSNAYRMKASSLESCKQLCLERGFGAFVVYQGYAYFRSQSAKLCREHLVEAPESAIYLSHASEALAMAAEASGSRAAPTAETLMEPGDVMQRFKSLVQTGARRELDRILERTRYFLSICPRSVIADIREELVSSDS